MSRRFAVAAVWVGAAALGVIVQACAANLAPSIAGPDGGTQIDSSTMDAGPPADPGVRVVVVNGLTRSVAASDAGKTARDVRLCFGKQGVALPSAGTMPLANYPGIARGRGVDLGQVFASPPSAKVQVDVLDANDVRLSTADGKCAQLTEPLGGPAAYVPSATASVSFVAGVNLLVLRDGPSGRIVIEQAVLSGKLGAQLDAGPRPIQGQFGVFSSWLGGDAAVNVQLDSDGGKVALATVPGAGKVGPQGDVTSFTLEGADPYEVSALRFSALGGAQPAELTQTFGSIQYVSDPTTSPSAFFERRESFAFVVIGDPVDTTALDVDGGRKTGFDGSELHVLAVPYAN